MTVVVSGSITLSSNVSPFVDEDNGDFNLNSTAGGGAACRNANTLSYPNIGASSPNAAAAAAFSSCFVG